MKVFLCWSGNESRRVAQVFHQWLPLFLENVQPFMSTGDIDKGAHWGTALQKELKGAVYGIIFVTRYSYKEPWINFEAGAISNTLDSSSVSPFLIQVTDEDIKGPLEQFESTKFEENDIYRLLNSINKNLGNIGRDHR